MTALLDLPDLDHQVTVDTLHRLGLGHPADLPVPGPEFDRVLAAVHAQRGPGPGRVSGLSDAHAAAARRVVLVGARRLINHRGDVHYTQDAEDRWEGIRHGVRIMEGGWIHRGDCSSTHHWLMWNALTHVGARNDTVSAAGWSWGWTGSIYAHGKVVRDLRNAKVGDAVLYGNPFGSTGHVATYVGGGVVFSHGSEPGPFMLGIDYRPDRVGIRRNI